MFTLLARFWLQNTALCGNFEMGHGHWLASFGCLWTTSPGSEIQESTPSLWRRDLKVHSLCSKCSKNAVIASPKIRIINQPMPCQSAQEWLCLGFASWCRRWHGAWCATHRSPTPAMQRFSWRWKPTCCGRGIHQPMLSWPRDVLSSGFDFVRTLAKLRLWLAYDP